VRGEAFYLVILLCMININEQVKFNAHEVAWKAMSLSLNCIIIKEKETHNHIEALIKKNSEF
jgi:predicted transcriptional regulator